MPREFGLIGNPLSHSFSADYFQKKFATEQIQDADYQLFPLSSLQDLRAWVAAKPNLEGFNVTIPYKQEILQLVDYQDVTAKEVGAANVVKVVRNGGDIVVIAFNTDLLGFERSLSESEFRQHRRALILGSGGAAAAVHFVLEKYGVATQFVSRQKRANALIYSELTDDILRQHTLIVNATPVGMFPNIGEAPALPYAALTPDHLLYDLVYNPAETEFLNIGRRFGAATQNGYRMFVLQAEASWEIWQSERH